MVTVLKICGITNLDDALQAVEAGATALGFNLWPRSPRYIEAAAIRRIVDRLPKTILKAGVFVDEPNAADLMRQAGLDLAQIHGDAPADIRYWQAWSAGTPSLRERMAESSAEAFLIDTPAGSLRGGTGKTFDWALAKGLPGRVILAGGLGPDNVAEAILEAQPWGVDACSRLEREPGLKDHAKVREFLKAARATTI